MMSSVPPFSKCSMLTCTTSGLAVFPIILDRIPSNYDVATNHLTDTTSATSVKAMRQACKNIMYTVVNSRVYDPANTVSTPIWRTAMIVVNVLLAVLLVVLEVLTFKSYKKKKAQ